MVYYEIREDWRVMFTHEYYFNTRRTLLGVKKYIKDWIEGWQDNAEDNEYKFLGFKTDYKTFANCRIRTDNGMDYFKIKVIKKKGSAKIVTALMIDELNEDMEEHIKSKI